MTPGRSEGGGGAARTRLPRTARPTDKHGRPPRAESPEVLQATGLTKKGGWALGLAGKSLTGGLLQVQEGVDGGCQQGALLTITCGFRKEFVGCVTSLIPLCLVRS